MAKIAIFGFGIVGGGIAEVLSQNYQLIKKSAGEDIEIKYIDTQFLLLKNYLNAKQNVQVLKA